MDYKAKYEEAMRALESLTPGGSEYVGDPKRCVYFVKEAQAMQHRVILAWAKRAKEAEAKLV